MSTQSISTAVLDADSLTKVYERSLDYCIDKKLNRYGYPDRFVTEEVKLIKTRGNKSDNKKR